MNWNDPEERFRLLERVGIKEYNRLLNEEYERQVVARVNGRAIRKMSSHFGTIYVVDGTSRGYSTLEQARRAAMETPAEIAGEAYARRTDPDTSHEAAEGMEGEQAAKYERIALAAFALHAERGLINDELVAATGIEWNAITPRVAPLRTRGLIERRVDPETLKWQTRMGHKQKPQQIHWITGRRPRGP